MKNKTYKLVLKERNRLRKLLDKGQGTWPTPDYVRDAIWDGWTHSLYTLQSILDESDNQPTTLDISKFYRFIRNFNCTKS